MRKWSPSRNDTVTSCDAELPRCTDGTGAAELYRRHSASARQTSSSNGLAAALLACSRSQALPRGPGGLGVPKAHWSIWTALLARKKHELAGNMRQNKPDWLACMISLRSRVLDFDCPAMLSFSTRNTAVLSVPLSNARGLAQVKCLRAHRSHSVVATVTVILGSWRRLRGFACRASRVDDVTAESRNLALQAELSKLGISFEALDRPPHDPLLSPALRCCKAFVSPATPRALQVSGQPGRAARVAADVAHLVRAARDALAAWKKETQMEVPSNTDGRLTLVMDCVRSTRNVGSLLRTCAVAGADVVFCGITPAPPMPAVLQAAGGASTVPSSFAVSSKSAVKELQQQGYQVP